MRISVIGFGAITDCIVESLEARGSLEWLGGVLVRSRNLDEAVRKARGRFDVVTDTADLFATNPDIIIEAAGHEAVRELGPNILAQGYHLIVASVGALADLSVCRRLIAAGKGCLWIASGAVAGLDGLLAARSAGLDEVLYRSIKPPRAWQGTPAERLLDLDCTRGKVVFFRGSAREAARLYPKNVNVGATIALASLGLDRTEVQLECDDAVPGPLGIITASGAFGRFSFEILALAAPNNPKTSAITGHSIASAVLDGMRFSPPIALLT